MLYSGPASIAKDFEITTPSPLQPDQRTGAWEAFVEDYEAAFEPLTDAFAEAAFTFHGSLHGTRLIDVCCGAGGAALLAARRGADVLAVDAAPAMVARVAARARETGADSVTARVMDAGRLDVPDATFDIAYSGFGIVLLPDPLVALRELHRVLTPHGRAIVVTWTQPQDYELAGRLGRSIESICGPRPATGAIPAQLRYADPAALTALFVAAGFAEPRIGPLTGRLVAPSATILASRLAFAPGMAALLDGLGAARAAVVARFVAELEHDFGRGEVSLGAIAHAAVAGRRLSAAA